MTDRCGHSPVAGRLAFCAVAAIGSKGGEALEEQDAIVPLGHGGRLRPPLFFMP